MSQTATITFFQFKGFSNKAFAAAMVYRCRTFLSDDPDVAFFKMLGCGGGKGYSLKPNLSRYALLIVWNSEKQAASVLDSAIYKHILPRSAEQYTIFLKPISSKGSWSGFSDWQPSLPDNDNRLIVAITRATIKPKFLYGFWKMTPKVKRDHEKTNGLILTQGLSEKPILEQCTFSIWSSKEAMEEFAYRSFHSEAVFATRKADGFSEEMFTRLQPIGTYGTLDGEDPVGSHLKKQLKVKTLTI